MVRRICLLILVGTTCLAQALSTVSASEKKALSVEIAELIEQLGHRDYFQRQRASARLADLGAGALPALERARHHEDMEIRYRANELYERLFSPIRQFTGPTPGTYSVAISPDAHYVLSGGDDSFVRLWDAKTGKEMSKLKHNGQVWAVTFSTDSKHFMTGDSTGQLTLWDAATQKEIRKYSGHTRAVRSIRFSPDNKKVVTGGYDNVLRLWDVETGQMIREMKGHNDLIMTVAFSPDGKRILSGGMLGDKTLRLWNVETGEEIHCMRGHNERVMGSAFSPDGTWLASGSWDGTIRLWDPKTGKETKRFATESKVYEVAITRDGRTVIGACSDGLIRAWNVELGQEVHRYKDHDREVTSVSISSKGNYLLSGGLDGRILFWNLN